MELTSNYNLKKPDYSDAALIEDLNDNADIIDTTMQDIENTAQSTKGNLEAHMNDKNNPHEVHKEDIITQEQRVVTGIANSGQEVNFQETHNITFDAPPNILVAPLYLPTYDKSKPNDHQVQRVNAQNITAEAFVPQAELIIPSTAQFHAMSPKPYMYAKEESWTSPMTNPNTTRIEIHCRVRLAVIMPPNTACTAYMKIQIFARKVGSTEWVLYKNNTVSSRFATTLWNFGVNAKSEVFGHTQVLDLSSDRYEFKVELAELSSSGDFGLDPGSGRSWLRVDSWQESSELVLATGQVQYMAVGPMTVE